MSNQKEYSANNIKVLRGLEPVQTRPGMYTRTESPTHIIQEVLDNAADEALSGYAKRIHVTMYKNGQVSVEDDGRGIPVEVPDGETKPAIELVFTQLHSGGKFEKDAYKFSGGLHGVGVSVTNALSLELAAEVKRNGQVSRIKFENGDIVEPLFSIGKCLKTETGTKITCKPDPKYFDSPNVSLTEMEHLVRSKAVLLPGVSMTLEIESSDGFITKSWLYPGGLTEYLTQSLPEIEEGVEKLPVIAGEHYLESGEGARWAVFFNSTIPAKGESYVNLIPTLSGGTHEAGFRNGVFEAVKSFAEHHAMMPKNIKLSAEDVWGNCNFILSSRVSEPQFQGQTKEKLTSRDAMRVMATVTTPLMENWLNEHPDMGKKIAEMVIMSATIRTKSITKVEKKKTSGISMMPDKLTDCEFAGTMEAELFLVEGDSAGGSAKMGRDKLRQSVLPLKGKIKNAWEVNQLTVLSFQEIHDLFMAIGIEPHTDGSEVDMSGLRYGKVCILADADVDGQHIQSLLLTMFIKHAPELIRRGHLYIALPPLFKVEAPAKSKNKEDYKIYVSDETEKKIVIDKLIKDGVNPDKIVVGRFKGLGEMQSSELWETTLCPDTRRLVQVNMDDEDMEGTLAMFGMLMSKNESESRKEWMETKGHLVEGDH